MLLRTDPIEEAFYRIAGNGQRILPTHSFADFHRASSKGGLCQHTINCACRCRRVGLSRHGKS